MIYIKNQICILFLAASLAASSCSTIHNSSSKKTNFIKYYSSGDRENTEKILEKNTSYYEGSGDELMWRLEQGTIYFDNGKYAKSLHCLEKAELIINDHDRRAAINVRHGAHEVASAFTNLNALPYTGTNYDRILLNCYKAMDYFAMQKPEDAMVDLRRAYERQKDAVKRFDAEIKEINQTNREMNRKNKDSVDFDDLLKNSSIRSSYESALKKANKQHGNLTNPFVTLLMAIGFLYEKDYSNALVAFKKLYLINLDNSYIRDNYSALARKTGIAADEINTDGSHFNYDLTGQTVYVIFANGLAPSLSEKKIQLLLPYIGYTGFAYPVLKYHNADIRNLTVTTSDKKTYNTELVSSMDSVIAEEYSMMLPYTVTRTAISTLTKEMVSFSIVRAAEKAGESLEMKKEFNGAGGNLLGLLAVITTSIYKQTFNTADTRSWQTLPKEYRFAQLPYPSDDKLQIKTSGNSTPGKACDVKLNKKSRITIIYIRSVKGENLTVTPFYID